MKWFKRNPRRIYHWEPMANITTEELAACVEMLIAEMHRLGDVDLVYAKLSQNVKRHWRLELK